MGLVRQCAVSLPKQDFFPFLVRLSLGLHISLRFPRHAGSSYLHLPETVEEFAPSASVVSIGHAGSAWRKQHLWR